MRLRGEAHEVLRCPCGRINRRHVSYFRTAWIRRLADFRLQSFLPQPAVYGASRVV